MAVVPASRFAAKLEQLDHTEFIRFVARLWEHSDWQTETDGNLVIAHDGETTERLLVVQGSRFARLQSVSQSGADVDRVVTTLRRENRRRLPRGTPDVPIITADALRDRLLYALEAAVAEQLCQELLDLSLRDERWESAPQKNAFSDQLSRVSTAIGGEKPAPLSRRGMLGLLGFGVVGGGALAVRSRMNEPADAGTLAETPPPEPETVTPDVTIEFEYENEMVTIKHTAGEKVPANTLVVRGEGFPGEPERRFSDWPEYTGETPVRPGNSVQMALDPGSSIEVFWEGASVQTPLESFRAPSGETVPVSVPDLEFAYSQQNGTVRIAHNGNDTFRARNVVIRKSGLNGTQAIRWNESVAVQATTEIEPGQSVSITASETAVLRLYWEDGVRDPVLLSQYAGPGRPLDPERGSVGSFRYGPANRGSISNGTGPVKKITTQWTFETAGPIAATPAVVDGRVFVGSLDNNLYAVDAVDGAELWRFETDGGIGTASPAVGPENVYIGSFDGSLYALDPATGKNHWTYSEFDRVLSAPTVHPDDASTVYVCGSKPGKQGMLAAVNTQTGDERWQFELGEDPSGTPAVVGETIYIGSGNGHVYALNAADGTVRWEFIEPAEKRGSNAGVTVVDSSPAVSDGTVYAACGSRFLYALNAADGTEQWRAETGGPIGSSPAISTDENETNETVYIGSSDWNMYAFDGSDGSEKWRFETQDPIYASPTVTGSPSSASGTVYVGSFDFHVYALAAADGSKRWQFETDTQILSSPVLAGGTLYVGSGDQRLYALTAPDTK